MSRRKHGFLYLLGLVLSTTISLATGSENVPNGLSASDWSGIRPEYERNQRAIYKVGSDYRARNGVQQWLTRFDERGFVLEPAGGGWSLGVDSGESCQRAGSGHRGQRTGPLRVGQHD